MNDTTQTVTGEMTAYVDPQVAEDNARIALNEAVHSLARATEGPLYLAPKSDSRILGMVEDIERLTVAWLAARRAL